MQDRIGDYELRGNLGHGAMGAVYRAWDPRAGREVAIKVLIQQGERQRRRFQREAEVLAGLRHSNIVSVQAAGETERGHPYLVMDLVHGSSLADRLEAEGALPVGQAVEITWHLAQALAHAHERGVLHRDLKPANVLLTEDGRPLLTDFGLAKELDTSRSQLTVSGHAMGSPGFWPPEQARGDQAAIGPASDLYGLGAVLYALLTNQPPIQGQNMVEILSATLQRAPTPPSALRPEVDPDLERIVLRCLEKEPDARYRSAQDLADALDGWLLGHSSRRKTGPIVWLGLGAAALAFLVGTALFVRSARSTSPSPTSSSTSPTPERPAPTATAAKPTAPGAARLWSIAVGESLRYRLSRHTARGDGATQSARLELTITQRLNKEDTQGAHFTLTIERLTMRNVQDRVTIFEYDSAKPGAQHQGLHARVERKLLASRPAVLLDLETGQVRGLGGVPTLFPPGSPRDPATQLIIAVLGVVSDQGVFGCLQTAWHVVRPDPKTKRWHTQGKVWPAGGVRYETRREFKPRGDGFAVSGRATAQEATIPSGLNENYSVGDLKLRGRVRFSKRGLEQSKQVMDYSIAVGNYPGPRSTTLEFVRLD